MNIELGGIGIIRTVTEPASDNNKVDLKKPIIRTVSEGPYGYTVTAFPRAFRRPRKCSILNGLIRFPLPPYKEATN